MNASESAGAPNTECNHVDVFVSRSDPIVPLMTVNEKPVTNIARLRCESCGRSIGWVALH